MIRENINDSRKSYQCSFLIMYTFFGNATITIRTLPASGDLTR